MNDKEFDLRWELNQLKERSQQYLAEISKLRQQLAAAQARIAELREALENGEHSRNCPSSGDYPIGQCDCGRTGALARTDDLSALEAVKTQARREALMEAARACEQHGQTLGAILGAEIRRMAEGVK